MSNLNIQTLDFVESADAALTAARELATKVAQDAAAVAQKLPGEIERFKQANLIEAHEANELRRKLASHAGSLEVIHNLVSILQETKQAYEQRLAARGPGQGTGVAKQADARQSRPGDAGADLSRGGYVGRRTGVGELRESDLPLLKAAGLDITRRR